MTARRIAAPSLALVAALGLALAGCAPTGPGAGPGQSAEGFGTAAPTTVPPSATGSSEEGTTCADIRAASADLTARVERGVELISSDPQAAVAELSGAVEEVRRLQEGASDSNLKRMLDDIGTKLDELIAAVSDGVALEEVGSLTSTASELSQAATTLVDYCQEH